MKKLLALLLTLALLVTALVACGNKDNPPYNDSDNVPSESNNNIDDSDNSLDNNQTEENDVIIDQLPASQGLEYTLSDDGTYYSVSRIGTCSDSDLVIPGTYNGLPVKKIDNDAFNAFDSESGNVKSQLRSVTIQSGVEEIGLNAFSGCVSLRKIQLSNTIKYIGDRAFGECAEIESVNIPSSVEFTDSLDNIFLYSTILNINEYEGCGYVGNKINPYMMLVSVPTEATEIKIHKDTKVIQALIFEECYNLTKIFIPDGIEILSDLVCPNRENWEYNEYKNGLYLGNISNPYTVLMKAKDNTVSDFEIHENTQIVHLELPNVESLVIPNGVKQFAIGGCYSLKAITLPNTIKSIDNEAFRNCIFLKNITIPNSVISIGDYAFESCTALESVNMPDSVTYLGIGAFSECHALKTVKISNALTQILEYTFDGCEALEAIDLPDGLISIGERAFYLCGVQSANDTVVEIPETVTTIGEDAFVGVQLLKFANGEMIIPDCAYQGSSITSLVVAEGTTEIGSHAFEHAESLEWIYLPKTLSKIGSYAFNYCYAEAIYYNGSYDEFYAIEVGTANDGLFSYAVERYFYSEEKPTEDGNLYWHYVDGVPTPW